MTLGSCAKCPNNMICREWVWKGLPLDARLRSGPWSLDGGLVMIFMEAHTKVGLACMAKPYTDEV